MFQILIANRRKVNGEFKKSIVLGEKTGKKELEIAKKIYDEVRIG